MDRPVIEWEEGGCIVLGDARVRLTFLPVERTLQGQLTRYFVARRQGQDER